MNAFIGKRVPQYLTATLKQNEEFDINNAVNNISDLLDNILKSLTENEITFIKSFPNVIVDLFDNDLIDEKVKKHPMIIWKQSLI